MANQQSTGEGSGGRGAKLHLRLRPTAETIIRGGHPWVFEDSIREQNRPGAAGELAVIFDRNDRFLAVGLYDPASPIRVRVLHAGKPVVIDAAWWEGRLAAALARRERLFGAETTGYRCIHGENDGFPGLVLDRYGSVCVLKVYSAAWFSRLRELAGMIQRAVPGCRSLVLRLARNVRQSSELPEGALLGGEPVDALVQFLENGLCFEADVLRGQKTGFFLDQRENRVLVGGLAAGREVLNAFSFSGGFSLYAARGGAVSATDLDISPHALAGARRHFELNRGEAGVRRCAHHTAQSDTFEWLARRPDRSFGLIVLDPPSLAKQQSEKAGALRAYAQLAERALPWLAPEGVLVAASCSAQVAPGDFFGVLEAVARRNDCREIERTEAPADHPASFPEARYLKCVYLRGPRRGVIRR